MLGKTDNNSAYRVILVHPVDKLFLDMEWQGNIFVDTALPFGLRPVLQELLTLLSMSGFLNNMQGVQSTLFGQFHYMWATRHLRM